STATRKIWFSFSWLSSPFRGFNALPDSTGGAGLISPLVQPLRPARVRGSLPDNALNGIIYWRKVAIFPPLLSGTTGYKRFPRLIPGEMGIHLTQVGPETVAQA